MSTTIIVILIIAGVLLLLFVSYYNRFVRLRNTRENAFADIDVQLKQRHDLIGQLVEVVKGYSKHESETLTNVIAARSSALGATSINDKIAAESRLTIAVNALHEAYPDLKANTNFMHLQTEIGDVENKLAAIRRYFNSTTKELNTAVESFPGNIIAGMFGFSRQPMFDLGGERVTYDKAPEIKF